MVSRSRFAVAAAFLLANNGGIPVDAYTSPAAFSVTTNNIHHRGITSGASLITTATALSSKQTSDDEHDDNQHDEQVEGRKIVSSRNFLQRTKDKLLKPVTLAAFTAGTLTASSSSSNILQPPPAYASAPIAPIAKFKPPDQKADALKKIRDEQKAQRLKEAMAHQVKCEEIELAEGKEAREAYDAEYKAAQDQRAADKVVARKKLQYDLIEKGICPFADVEGIRQMYLFDNEIDLNFIPSTAQMNDAMRLRRSPKLVKLREKQRFVIKCIVDDVKLKGEDPVEFLQQNMEKTKEVFELNERKIDAITARYQSIIAEKGSLSGTIADKPFDTAAAIMGSLVDTSGKDEATLAKEAKAEAAKVKAAAKEKLKQEKAVAKAEAAKLKAEAKAAKAAEKAEAKAAKDQAKAEAKAAKEDAKAQAAAAAAASLEAQTQTDAAPEVSDTSDGEVVDGVETMEETAIAEIEEETAVVADSKKSSGLPVAPIATVVGIGGGSVAFKVWKDKAAEAEEERQRQFQLLMGVNDDDDDEDDEEEESVSPSSSTKTDSPSPTPAPAPAPKKKRSGIASVFSKKNANNRETDLNNLVSSDAPAAELATLLAKLLTFGAPGRFPDVKKLPGEFTMKEFSLDEAKELLTAVRTKLGLSDEVSAETFASVVNCMIIDIIDLASSSLGAKEKKNKTTVDALNIVMDFMDHAASLFDSVAGEVAINPVTYGGTLGKNKLEQMFTIYASSMMTTMDGSITQDRVDTLQQVFNINDKKAEGMVQKGMMKNLMNMMKDGGEGLEGMEGMEGLSEMMAAMGGEGGMDGLPGFDGGEPTPEELKQSISMMKELVDSGSVSKDELDLVRKQFQEVYGSDIQDLIKAADEEGADDLGDDGKELLDLFKTILEDE